MTGGDTAFRATVDPDSNVVVVSGAVDELSIDAFRDSLREVTQNYSKPAVIDFMAVTFLPSMAIGVLLGALARAPGTRVVLVEGTPAFRALQVLGLDEYVMNGRTESENGA
jgi:anti-anti-sigma factor